MECGNRLLAVMSQCSGMVYYCGNIGFSEASPEGNPEGRPSRGISRGSDLIVTVVKALTGRPARLLTVGPNVAVGLVLFAHLNLGLAVVLKGILGAVLLAGAVVNVALGEPCS